MIGRSCSITLNEVPIFAINFLILQTGDGSECWFFLAWACLWVLSYGFSFDGCDRLKFCVIYCINFGFSGLSIEFYWTICTVDCCFTIYWLRGGDLERCTLTGDYLDCWSEVLWVLIDIGALPWIICVLWTIKAVFYVFTSLEPWSCIVVCLAFSFSLAKLIFWVAARFWVCGILFWTLVC